MLGFYFDKYLEEKENIEAGLFVLKKKNIDVISIIINDRLFVQGARRRE